jgi:hypothetical protein
MPLPRSPRRLEEDPENEPDLHAISRLYPLPLDGNRYPEALVQEHAAPVVYDKQQQQPTPAVQHQKKATATGTVTVPDMSSFPPVGLVGYPQGQQLLLTGAAPTTSYAATTATTPRFISCPVVGSLSTIAATNSAAAPFQTASAPMQYGQLTMACGGAPPTAAPTLIYDSNGHQQFLGFAPDPNNKLALGNVAGSSAPPSGTPLHPVISAEFGK